MIGLERVVARLTDSIVVVSRYDESQAREHGIRPRGQLTVIHNGITGSTTSVSAVRNGDLRLRMVMTARFSEQKDHDTLLRAVSQLRAPYELSSLGDGPRLECVKGLSSQLGLGETVNFLGATTDVDYHLSRSDLGILITKWEGLPISILEYMRAGLAVIATDVGGVCELVDHEKPECWFSWGMFRVCTQRWKKSQGTIR